MRAGVFAVPATAANFEEHAYLAANPDVAAALKAGAIKSGREHFEASGLWENRSLWSAAPPEALPSAAISRIPEVAALLHHHLIDEPDLPFLDTEPTNRGADDLDTCGRLIAAFSRAAAFERQNIGPENRPNDAVWEALRPHHREAYLLLEEQDAVGLSDYLREGLRRDLSLGLGVGRITAPDWQKSVIPLLVLDRLAAAAEAIGSLPVENPEQGRFGETMRLDMAELAEMIERRVGFSVERPRVMGNFGIAHRGGLIDLKVPDDVYCAFRARSLASTGIEIGGGFGGMALFALRAGASRWSIVDLPVINVMQGYFLIKCLGASAVRLYGEDNSTAGAEVLPYWEFFNSQLNFSLVFNRDSLPEIQRARVDEYLSEIERRECSFLSINQEAQAMAGRPGLRQHMLHELIAKRGKLTCVSRHPYWVRKGYVEELYQPRTAAGSI